ncbi:MAG: hypothetical protein M3404_02195, partial [Actinomycetota bacterium]|nr:hypothetical protein [Actinomycetota bacterium]
MRRTNAAETGSDRVALAKDAGMGRVSLFGVLAGTLVAYGAFLVLLTVVAAVANALNISDKIATLNWNELGVTGGLIVAAVLLLSYLFGGYVAGRMARRAGALNGFLVFVLGVLVAVGVSLLVNLATDGEDILRNFRAAGIPTSTEEWGDAGTVAGIASLVAIIVGPILGGILGERWHAKLISKAMDPSVGTEARYRQDADDRRLAAEERHTGAEQRAGRGSPTPAGREEESRRQEPEYQEGRRQEGRRPWGRRQEPDYQEGRDQEGRRPWGRRQEPDYQEDRDQEGRRQDEDRV